MNKKILLPLLLLIPISSHAGFWEFTMHSRANCVGFNESISWHFKHEYWLLTNSYHSNPKAAYTCNFWSAPNFEVTSRSAALHFAEGYGGWHVIGSHWTTPDRGRTSQLMAKTDAIDCNIYDGWWDV